MGKEPRGPWGPPTLPILGVAVAVAALVRIAWAIHYYRVLDQDGVEYVRIAENLLSGRGYVGIFGNGPQLNYAPLYPLMIAAASLLTSSAEVAARAINVIFGAALVVPMYLIADRLYGRRPAVTVAALVAFHPTLVAFGAATYAEGPYLTLLMCAVVWLMKWATDRRILSGAMGGAFLGLSYLVRPEAFVFAGVAFFAGLAAAVHDRDRRPMSLGSLALALVFVLVASPYVAFLTRATGEVRVEGKGAIAYQWGEKMNEGMTYKEAAYGIGNDLSAQGVFMRPNLDVVRSTRYTPGELVPYLLRAARRNVGKVHRAVVDGGAFGSPALFLIVVIGLFRSRWSRQRLALEGILLATIGTLLFVLFTVQHLQFRFFYPLLGPLLIWGGKGADELAEWLGGTAASVSGREGGARVAASSARWACVGLVVLLAFRGLPETQQFWEAGLEERAQAGRWLAREHPGRKWIMDTGVQVAYYANGNVMYLPYTDSSRLALEYVAKRDPAYIVLHSIAKSALPYTARWFDEGIPDSRAVLVYDEGGSREERIKIYRWADGVRPPL